MRDRACALMLSLGAAMAVLGWGLQQGAIQGRIASDSGAQRHFWSMGGSVLDLVKPASGLEGHFDLGTLLLAVGAGLAVVSWRFPKPH